MASVVPGQEQQQQQQWTDKFKKEVIASDKDNILAWFDKSKDPVKNPAYLIGLDDEGKKHFEYIIEGLILSIEEGPEKAKKVKDIVDELKKYYISLTESDNELVIIDLLVKVSEKVPNLKLPKAFSLPDFQYHIPEGWLNCVNFFEFCGLAPLPELPQQGPQAQPVNPSSFLTHIKAVLSPKKITELENLADIYEEDTLNLRYKFKYNLKKAAMTNNIVLCIVEHLIANYHSYTTTVISEKLNKIRDSIAFLYEDFYTSINATGLSPPIGLFRDFNKIFSASADDNKNHLHILYWYFKKIERVFEHTAVTDLKTQESLYDLFDLIEVDAIDVSETLIVQIRSHDYPFPAETVSAVNSMEEEKEQKEIYPLRTMHFRKDFKVNITDTITIEQVQIPPAFWRAIDKSICFPRKLPFSYFHGIITSDQLLLPPLHAMLIDETNVIEEDEENAIIFEVLDDIAEVIGVDRCIKRNTREGLVEELYANIEGDGYELKEEASAELSISTLLQMSAMNLVYAANVKATYITNIAAAQKLEGVAFVYLNYAFNKAISENKFNESIQQILGTINNANFIINAYYNYFNNTIKYGVAMDDKLINLLVLLTQIPRLATAEDQEMR